MRNLKKVALTLTSTAVLSTLVLSSQSFALDQIIRPYQSARSSGMGGLKYTTGIYDENFFANPARAADNPTWRIDILNTNLEINSGSIENVDKLSDGGNSVANAASTTGTNNHLRFQNVLPAIYIPRAFSSKHSVAIGLIQSMQADIDIRRNISVDPTAIMDIGPAATYARRFLKEEKLAVGITGHVAYRVSTKDTFSTIQYLKDGKFNFKNYAGEGMHYDFDLGSTYDVPWKPAGFQFQGAFAINNILGGKYKNLKADFVSGETGKVTPQPRTFNGGVSASREALFGLGKVTVAFEIQDVGNNANGSLFRTFHLGSELNLKDWVMVRAGINQGYLCAGVGFDLPVLKIDLATYGEEMSLNVGGLEDRRYAIRIGFAI